MKGFLPLYNLTITCTEDRTRALPSEGLGNDIKCVELWNFQGRNDKDGSEKLSQRPQQTEETAL